MKKKIIIFSIFAIIILGIIVFILFNNKQPESPENTTSPDEIDLQNSAMYQDTATINELKKEYNVSGQDDIYDVQTEYDGRKILVIKPEIDYKVAFAGLIKKDIPKKEEVDRTFEENYPKNSGVWVEEDSRGKFLDLLKNSELVKNEYKINNDGYLEISKASSETETDKKLEKMIKSENSYIFAISGTSYSIDAVTGEIMDNPFESMDSYQIYEYFESGENKIVFITENENKKLTDKEILEGVVNLIQN